jgi:hypothetical protein
MEYYYNGSGAKQGFAAGQWEMLSATVSGGGSVQMYRNGTPSVSFTTTVPDISGQGISVGYDETGTAVQFWNGRIDELVYWGRGLSDEEHEDAYYHFV